MEGNKINDDKPKITRKSERKTGKDDDVSTILKCETNLSVLTDMAFLGNKTKGEIEKNEKNKNLIEYEKALAKTNIEYEVPVKTNNQNDKKDKEDENKKNKEIKENKERIFVLGLIGKYLEEFLSIKSRIDVANEFKDEENQNDAMNLFRYVSYGFITKYKYKISTEKDQSCKDVKYLKNKFIGYEKKLNNDNFVFTDDKNNKDKKNFVGIFIPFNSCDVELNKDPKEFKYALDNVFNNKPVLFDKSPIIDAIILNLGIFTTGHDIKDDSVYGKNEKRGKEDYYPPLGWFKWALKIKENKTNKEENYWFGYDPVKSWCSGYIGLGNREAREEKVKKIENCNDMRNNGKTVGLGVWLRQNPKKMEEDCSVIEVGNEKYKVGFWMRVKPEAIRIANLDGEDYWVVNGIWNELRPYAIITKKIN